MRIRDVGWNLLGLGTPAAVAALTIPAIIDRLALERFGLLTLMWGAVAFSGLFDLGIGRATTQAVARARAQKAGGTHTIVATGLRLSLLSGAVGAVLLATLAFAGAASLLKYSPSLDDEVRTSVLVLALVIPTQTIGATLRGICEAFERFRGVSLVRIIVGSGTFLGPYLTSLWTPSLTAAALTLLATRVVALAMFKWLTHRCLEDNRVMRTTAPASTASTAFDKNLASQLLRFGGWITVSGIVYPLMMQADRFLIGAKISSSAVATYTIPYEVVMQVLTVVGAVTTVAFPRLTVLQSASPAIANRLFRRLMLGSIIGMALVAITLAATLGDLLSLWLHRELPQASVTVGRVLCLGLVPFTIGTLLVSSIHAKGRADITAKAHLLQAPIYVYMMYWSVSTYAQVGAAWVWAGRVTIDAAMIYLWIRNHDKKASPARDSNA